MKILPFKFLAPGLIILAGISIFIVLVMNRPSAQPAVIQHRVWQVNTLTARLATLAPELTLYGQVENPALVKAAAANKGRVLSVLVREGDPVSQGQLLLKLDPRDFEPLVQQAAAKVSELDAMLRSQELQHQSNQQTYKHEQTLLALSKSAVDRAKSLSRKKLGSVAALEEAQQAYQRQQLEVTERQLKLSDYSAIKQQLQARLTAAQADLELARLKLERSQIISPFDGFVEKVQVASGDQVNENQLLISFYPIDQLEVRAKIPAVLQHEFQQSLKQQQKLTATTLFAGTRLALQFDRVSGVADARGIDGLFTFIQGGKLIRLGSTLSLLLKRPEQTGVVAIPYSALYDNDRIYIAVDGKLQALSVKRLGELINTDGNPALLISSPQLHNGDQIVTTNLPNAMNGLRVTNKRITPHR